METTLSSSREGSPTSQLELQKAVVGAEQLVLEAEACATGGGGWSASERACWCNPAEGDKWEEGETKGKGRCCYKCRDMCIYPWNKKHDDSPCMRPVDPRYGGDPPKSYVCSW